MTPKISIIFCNFNNAHFLHDSLGSIVKQTTPPFECLVIDDASTDNSVDIIKKYEKDFSFINFIQNTKNQGVLKNIRFALSIAKGDYVCYFSSDDSCENTFIEKTIKCLTKYPKAGLACSIPAFINADGTFKYAAIFPKKVPEYIPPDQLVTLIKNNFLIAGHTAIIKKSYLIEAGGHITDLAWHCDWFSFLVIAFRYGICFVPHKLAFLRVQKTSYSSNSLKWRKQKKVLETLFALLNMKKYNDIKNHFIQSNVLFVLPKLSEFLLLNNKRFTKNY